MKAASAVSLINAIVMISLVFFEHFGLFKFELIFSYQWHKLLHLAGVAMFMINMMIGPVWFFFAYGTENPEILRFSSRLMQLTDLMFTVPGFDFAIVNGLFLASAMGGTFIVPWLHHSVFLLILLFLFTIPVIVIQDRLYKEIESQTCSRQRVRRLLIQWSVLGAVLTLPPTLVFYLMVMKGW